MNRSAGAGFTTAGDKRLQIIRSGYPFIRSNLQLFRTSTVTHHYKLEDIVAAYDLFSNQRDGVLKVAIKP